MTQPLLSSIALVVLAAATPSLAQVDVDYDESFEWGSVASYGWMETKETNVNDLAHRRIVSTIDRYLAEFGLTKSSAEPDVWVTYHADTKDEVVVDVTSYDYAYPTTIVWGRGSRSVYGTAFDVTATPTSYRSGTLVIDVLSADDRKLIWRGTASGTIPDSTRKREKALDRAIGKMVKKWEKLRRKAAKEAKG